MNRAVEDYLKIIYKLTFEKDKNLAKVSEVAKELKFTEQTTNEMIKKLALGKLVEYIPYKGVKLTKVGQKEAVRLIRAHRIIELFLSNTLKMNWQEVHHEAEKLEHAASELVIDKLFEFLGNPKQCTHGNYIPNKDGSISKQILVKLTSLGNLERFKIIKVKDDSDLLAFLDSNQIKLNDTLKITKIDELNEIIFINVNKTTVAIGKRVSSLIYVIKV